MWRKYNILLRKWSDTVRAYNEVVFSPQILNMRMYTGEYRFMQGGNIPHRTGIVFDIINNMFENRSIPYQYPNSYPGELYWPSYSLNKKSCEFNLS